MARKQSMKAVVTGGGGFLGKALCQALLAGPASHVVSISRGSYPELEKIGVEHHRLNLAKDADQLREIFQDAEVVFHTAAKVEMWGAYPDFYRVNVLGTKNVINACRQAGVPYLVYTSSPSVIADGTNLCNVDETYPYAKNYKANYPKTKALAEQAVLEANDEKLATCSLRPHLIWGPGDTNLIPTILDRAKKKKLLRIGPGKNLVDTTYIDDCVEAHLLAAAALKNNPDSRGQAYFISQGEPVPLWDFVDQVLARSGLAKLNRSLGIGAAHKIAAVLEGLSKLFPFLGEPRLTRFLVEEMSTDHHFNITKAKSLLGYSPAVSISEGLERTFS